MKQPFPGDNLRLKSARGNDYLLNRSIPQVLLLHPIANHLMELVQKGTPLEEWISQLTDEDKIPVEDGITASKKDILYYFNLLRLLDENHYFKEQEKRELPPEMYTAKSIKFQLANTHQIVFEVCDFCSLQCRYCAYGDLYTGYDKRENKTLDIHTAKKLIDYMMELFQSPLNRRRNKKIAISFYGGEPLLNISFIKEIVLYTTGKSPAGNQFFYTMTTNGVDLDTHMDYLRKHDFQLLVSLDGSENHNAYRVFHDGSPSFKTVYNNILALKSKYPGYYEKNVRFNAVLHNKNSAREVKAFFLDHLGTEPRFANVNMLGIKKEKKEEFEKIQTTPNTSPTPKEIKKDSRDKSKIMRTPFARDLDKFFKQFSGFVFNKYDRLLRSVENPRQALTGTCHPFEMKIFITANGKILPCERILQTYSLGNIDKEGVHIDFTEVAAKYNDYFKKLNETCKRCSNNETCSICIFNLQLQEDNPQCDDFLTEENLERKLQNYISLVEDMPWYYPRIMRT